MEGERRGRQTGQVRHRRTTEQQSGGEKKASLPARKIREEGRERGREREREGEREGGKERGREG